jgi:hypothetical protein
MNDALARTDIDFKGPSAKKRLWIFGGGLVGVMMVVFALFFYLIPSIFGYSPSIFEMKTFWGQHDFSKLADSLESLLDLAAKGNVPETWRNKSDALGTWKIRGDDPTLPETIRRMKAASITITLGPTNEASKYTQVLVIVYPPFGPYGISWEPNSEGSTDQGWSLKLAFESESFVLLTRSGVAKSPGLISAGHTMNLVPKRTAAPAQR